MMRTVALMNNIVFYLEFRQFTLVQDKEKKQIKDAL
jgi:hypothetical protein